MEPTVHDEEATQVRAEVTTLPATVRELRIVDDTSFQAGATLLRRIKALRASIAKIFEPHIHRAFQAHRALVADRKALEAPLSTAEQLLKTALARFSAAEDLRRAAAARRDTAAVNEARTAQIWAEVESLEAAGLHGEASELASELVRAPIAVVLTPAPLKADGLARREVWKYQVVDEARVPREYCTIDHTKLGAVVRALKGTTAIPGVRVWAERIITATGR